MSFADLPINLPMDTTGYVIPKTIIEYKDVDSVIIFYTKIGNKPDVLTSGKDGIFDINISCDDNIGILNYKVGQRGKYIQYTSHFNLSDVGITIGVEHQEDNELPNCP